MRTLIVTALRRFVDCANDEASSSDDWPRQQRLPTKGEVAGRGLEETLVHRLQCFFQTNRS